MAHLNHTPEEVNETAATASRPAKPSTCDASTDAVCGERDPRAIQPRSCAAGSSPRLPPRRRDAQSNATFDIAFGEGLTDDQIVDGLAHLLLAVSHEQA
jgi:hypothetical protein